MTTVDGVEYPLADLRVEGDADATDGAVADGIQDRQRDNEEQRDDGEEDQRRLIPAQHDALGELHHEQRRNKIENICEKTEEQKRSHPWKKRTEDVFQD